MAGVFFQLSDMSSAYPPEPSPNPPPDPAPKAAPGGQTFRFWPSLRFAAVSAGYIALYCLLDWASYIHPFHSLNITPWNPAAAFSVALLLLGGLPFAPVVAIAIYLSEYLVRDLPAPPLVTVLIALLITAGYALTAQLIRRGTLGDFPDLSLRGLLRTSGVIVAGSFLTGMVFVGTLQFMQLLTFATFWEALWRYWIGDLVGLLVTLPLLLLLWLPVRRERLLAAVLRWEAALLGSLIAGALWLVFAYSQGEEFKFFYVFFLPVIWAAVRYGLEGAALAGLAVQLGVIVAVQAGGHAALTVFELQMLTVTVVFAGYLLGVTIDERRLAAEDLKRSLHLAAAGEMAAALAHELNQPLTAVIAYGKACEMLAAAGDAQRTVLQQTLQRMLAEATRAGDVVTRLRDLFLYGATRLEPVSPATLVNDALRRFEPRAGQAGITVHMAMPDGLPEVLVDVSQIGIVLRNLLDNARDALADSSEKTIRVDAWLTGEHMLCIAVEDSGQGLTADVRARLFSPFVSSKPRGMGLGLAVSQAIVEAHGGRLWAEASDHGLFCFTLPIDQEHRHDAPRH